MPPKRRRCDDTNDIISSVNDFPHIPVVKSVCAKQVPPQAGFDRFKPPASIIDPIVFTHILSQLKSRQLEYESAQVKLRQVLEAWSPAVARHRDAVMAQFASVRAALDAAEASVLSAYDVKHENMKKVVEAELESVEVMAYQAKSIVEQAESVLAGGCDWSTTVPYQADVVCTMLSAMTRTASQSTLAMTEISIERLLLPPNLFGPFVTESISLATSEVKTLIQQWSVRVDMEFVAGTWLSDARQLTALRACWSQLASGVSTSFCNRVSTVIGWNSVQPPSTEIVSELLGMTCFGAGSFRSEERPTDEVLAWLSLAEQVKIRDQAPKHFELLVPLCARIVAVMKADRPGNGDVLWGAGCHALKSLWARDDAPTRLNPGTRAISDMMFDACETVAGSPPIESRIVPLCGLIASLPVDLNDDVPSVPVKLAPVFRILGPAVVAYMDNETIVDSILRAFSVLNPSNFGRTEVDALLSALTVVIGTYGSAEHIITNVCHITSRVCTISAGFRAVTMSRFLESLFFVEERCWWSALAYVLEAVGHVSCFRAEDYEDILRTVKLVGNCLNVALHHPTVLMHRWKDAVCQLARPSYITHVRKMLFEANVHVAVVSAFANDSISQEVVVDLLAVLCVFCADDVSTNVLVNSGAVPALFNAFTRFRDDKSVQERCWEIVSALGVSSSAGLLIVQSVEFPGFLQSVSGSSVAAACSAAVSKLCGGNQSAGERSVRYLTGAKDPSLQTTAQHKKIVTALTKAGCVEKFIEFLDTQPTSSDPCVSVMIALADVVSMLGGRDRHGGKFEKAWAACTD